jgi:hypothetical protein
MRHPTQTLTCLFLSKRGELAVHLLDSPAPEEYQIPPVPPGMMHALRLLGMADQVRLFKRSADGAMPVYEEV